MEGPVQSIPESRFLETYARRPLRPMFADVWSFLILKTRQQGLREYYPHLVPTNGGKNGKVGTPGYLNNSSRLSKADSSYIAILRSG